MRKLSFNCEENVRKEALRLSSANRQSTGSACQVSLFGSTITQTDKSVFSIHHSTDEHDGSMYMTNGKEDNDDQTMDMSIVQDIRRAANVFAVFTDTRGADDNDTAGPQIEELADDSPSPVKNGSLCPSIEKLQQETSDLQSPTPGDRALAFLDEEDKEYDRTKTTGDDAADQREDQTEGASEVSVSKSPIDEQDVEAEGEPSDSSTQAIELESAPTPFNPYDFRRHRLSIVPERRDEEDLEEEEDGDQTQDMEETQYTEVWYIKNQYEDFLRLIHVIHLFKFRLPNHPLKL
ncbi:hypothetical protein P389DRAFT_78686 [Cystobasidium minutum MCA 4210]|uniref:uncharacterized protein n=1 Tax=Cystobasidium minutum MCA 4210 TaxID=1397322 RepID=UPI0034CD7998|eukprot:jgi/Rhomi1/78686/CE78685_218